MADGESLRTVGHLCRRRARSDSTGEVRDEDRSLALGWPAAGETADEPPLTTTGTRGDRDTDSPVSRDEEPGEKRFSDRQSLASRPSRPSRAVRRRAIAIAPA